MSYLSAVLKCQECGEEIKDHGWLYKGEGPYHYPCIAERLYGGRASMSDLEMVKTNDS